MRQIREAVCLEHECGRRHREVAAVHAIGAVSRYADRPGRGCDEEKGRVNDFTGANIARFNKLPHMIV